MKCKYANKREAFTQSWSTRVNLAVLEFNWPGEWQFELAEMLGIEIHPKIRSQLEKLLHCRLDRRMKKQQAENLRMERIRRAIAKNKTSKLDSKTDDYVFHDKSQSKESPGLIDFDSPKKTTKIPATSTDKALPKKYLFSPTPDFKPKLNRKVQLAPFSRKAILKFPEPSTPEEAIIQATAKDVADLICGKSFKEQKGIKRTIVEQGNLSKIIISLSENEKEQAMPIELDAPTLAEISMEKQIASCNKDNKTEKIIEEEESQAMDTIVDVSDQSTDDDDYAPDEQELLLEEEDIEYETVPEDDIFEFTPANKYFHNDEN